jgi:hypothetical protein
VDPPRAQAKPGNRVRVRAPAALTSAIDSNSNAVPVRTSLWAIRTPLVEEIPAAPNATTRASVRNDSLAERDEFEPSVPIIPSCSSCTVGSYGKGYRQQHGVSRGADPEIHTRFIVAAPEKNVRSPR